MERAPATVATANHQLRRAATGSAAAYFAACDRIGL